MAKQLLSVGLALNSIWEKARARDGQGMRLAAEARPRDGQKLVVGDKEQWTLFCKG
jgi:hypothetical protein